MYNQILYYDLTTSGIACWQMILDNVKFFFPNKRDGTGGGQGGGGWGGILATLKEDANANTMHALGLTF